MNHDQRQCNRYLHVSNDKIYPRICGSSGKYVYIESVLDEDYYDTVRRNVENLLGPDDTYLEVFHQDMKYSDTPIAASIAEGVSDLFQVFYNFLETVRDATEDVVSGAVMAVADDFANYWSAILCNLLRAVNNIKYQG